MMRLAPWLLCVGLIACEPPFSGNIATFDEGSDAAPAAIQLSHEQIYRRETLINDRLAESEFLDGLLAMTTQEDFLDKAAQVSTQRQTAFSSATTFQAGLSFDPLAGASLLRSDEIAELDADVAKRQRTILDKRLAQLEEKLDNDQELTEADQMLIESVAADVKPAEPIGTDEALGAIVKRLSEIKAEPPLVTTAGASDASIDTLEAIRRVQAIRAQLRQAKAAVDLDDLHDYEGNALYRFQYTATVLPGKSKAQMGVAQLTFSPPMLSDAELERLYLDWLVHLNYQLNKPRASVRKGCPQQVFDDSLIAATRLARLVPLEAPNPADLQEICSIQIGLPLWDETAAKSQRYQDFVRSIESNFGALLDLRSEAELSSSQLQALQNFNTEEAKKPERDRAFGLTAEEFNRRLSDIANRPSLRSGQYLTQHLVPLRFKEALTGSRKAGETRALGNIYSYQALPFEQTKVSSVTASRSATRDIALSIAGRFLSQALGGTAAFGHATKAAAAADAIETTPIVVGFMEPSGDGYKNATVGWIFGPEPRVNAKSGDVELAHSLRAHSVSAEISMPGWWPRVTVHKKTEWIANWHGGAATTSLPGSKTTRDIRLVPNRGDMQEFTKLLIRRTFGDSGRFMKIIDVQPFFLSACEEQVTFRIHGLNLWRSAQVYFGGMKARGVRVLPDMEGIEATVDIKEFFETHNAMDLTGAALQNIPLTVETRDGSDTLAIPFTGARTKDLGGKVSCSAPTQVASVSATGRIALVQLVPNDLPACGGEASFIAKVTQAADDFSTVRFNLDGRSASHTPLPRKDTKARSRVFQVTAKLPRLETAGRTASLSVTDGEDISLAAVRLAKCDVAAPKAPTNTPKADKDKKKTPAPTAHYFTTLETKEDGTITFAITVDSKGHALREPGTALAVRVISDAGKPFDWLLTKGPPTPDQGKVTAPFEIPAKDTRRERSYYDEGPVMEAGLVTLDAKNKVTAAQVFSPRFVLYKKGTNPAEATAEGALLKRADDKAMVTLSFAAHIHTAFPGLASAKLTAEIDGMSDIALVVDPAKIPAAASKAKASTLKVTVKAKDPEALKAHFENGGGALPLSLKLLSALPLPSIATQNPGGS